MSQHYAGDRLILTEALCRPFILLHLTWTLITTSTRFFIPTPQPRPHAPLPFHHARSLPGHLFSTGLLALNTIALSHTSPWLFAQPGDLRSLLWLPRASPPKAVQPKPVWLRSAAEEKDPVLMWDMAACVVLLYCVVLVLSLALTALLSPLTFACAESAVAAAGGRRRRLLGAFAASVLLLMALCALLLFAYRVHLDCVVELSPFVLVELIRVATTWELTARGGRVIDAAALAKAGRVRGVDEDERDGDTDADDDASNAPEEFADLIAGAAESTGLQRRPLAAAHAPLQAR